MAVIINLVYYGISLEKKKGSVVYSVSWRKYKSGSELGRVGHFWNPDGKEQTPSSQYLQGSLQYKFMMKRLIYQLFFQVNHVIKFMLNSEIVLHTNSCLAVLYEM